MKYNPEQIEAKWQQYWAENQTFAAAKQFRKTKILCFGYVSLSFWSGIARWASARIYCF